MADRKHPVHPLVKKLEAAAGAQGAIKLLGYFGGSAGEGTVRIHPSLDDLSVYFEVREDDILHVEDADPSECPHGGSAIWVKGNAQVQRTVTRGTTTQARFLAGGIAARMAGGPAVTYGLASQAPLEPDTANCEGYSIWPCSVLIGACLASNDMPCAYTDAWWCQQVGTLESCIPTCGNVYTCNYLCHTVNCPPTRFNTCICGPITRRCEVATAVCRR
jgi:hypothetical protein